MKIILFTGVNCIPFPSSGSDTIKSDGQSSSEDN
jgi:hypothetical protein